uniref:Methyltransferase n=1 Tax=Ananas comosus var. bracteatus TaxID=296719 RepID=A0A6V7Q1U6_ANACO|nr:unnamed protein product [Ananas comosus var. bracteatus]
MRAAAAEAPSTPIRHRLQILLLVASTNLISVYFFSGASMRVSMPSHAPRFHLSHSDVLLRELNSTHAELSAAESLLSSLTSQCSDSSSLLQKLLSELGRVHRDKSPASSSAAADDRYDGWPEEPRGELKLAVGPHKLPLGFTPNIGADELFPPLGFACRIYQEEVQQYMTYEVGAECPGDAVFAQKLMLKGCEPLPRRRCRPKPPAGFPEPAPLPDSLWRIPADATVVWDAYTCKNYSCLVNRGRSKGGPLTARTALTWSTAGSGGGGWSTTAGSASASTAC